MRLRGEFLHFLQYLMLNLLVFRAGIFGLDPSLH